MYLLDGACAGPFLTEDADAATFYFVPFYARMALEACCPAATPPPPRHRRHPATTPPPPCHPSATPPPPLRRLHAAPAASAPPPRRPLATSTLHTCHARASPRLAYPYTSPRLPLRLASHISGAPRQCVSPYHAARRAPRGPPRLASLPPLAGARRAIPTHAPDKTRRLGFARYTYPALYLPTPPHFFNCPLLLTPTS